MLQVLVDDCGRGDPGGSERRASQTPALGLVALDLDGDRDAGGDETLWRIMQRSMAATHAGSDARSGGNSSS
jgi:hypothetical protein